MTVRPCDARSGNSCRLYDWCSSVSCANVCARFGWKLSCARNGPGCGGGGLSTKGRTLPAALSVYAEFSCAGCFWSARRLFPVSFPFDGGLLLRRHRSCGHTGLLSSVVVGEDTDEPLSCTLTDAVVCVSTESTLRGVVSGLRRLIASLSATLRWLMLCRTTHCHGSRVARVREGNDHRDCAAESPRGNREKKQK